MLGFGRAGITGVDGIHAGFAPVTERVYGNEPGWTGSPGNGADVPGPHPATQPGGGGNVGHYDGFSGPDQGSPGGKLPAHPRVDINGAEQENWNRPGVIGFNDQLQVRERHVYWDRGRQRFVGPRSNQTGGGANPQDGGPPRPDLRAVNISVNPMIGSNATKSQDDLTRPYTWLGQQDGSRQAIYGGVPGLWASYGNRGLSQNIHDPSNGEGGPAMVASGPPHGLHSDTIPSGKQVADRYKVTAQMRPVRFDRPSNSTIAGQSYSQTVQFQGSSGQSGSGAQSGLSFRVTGRGWLGG